jgi:hypothetical protein
MISKFKWSTAALSAVIMAAAAPAQAQWRATAIGVAEYDTKETLLLLAGLSASPGGQSVRPIIGVQGYHLGYDAGTAGRTNVFTIKPYVGLGNNYGSGDMYGTVGYSISNKDAAAATPSSNDVSEGVVLSGGWDHWGSGTPWGHQVLGSYNFGSEAFWGRGRATRRLSSGGPAQRRLGAEVAFLSGEGYSAWQPGAVLELHNGRGGILGLGAGMKFFGNNGGNAVYFKVEGVVPVVR